MSDNSKNIETQEEFTGWRSILWPIYNFELKKFLPMGLMMLCILFIYTLVRDLKDTLMVSKAIGGGSETLGFIKLYCVTPAAILFMMGFMKLANMFDSKKLFLVIVGFFLAFFVTFGFILYPFSEYIHFSQATIDSLRAEWPRLYWVWPVIGNWSYTLFYIISELWGSVVLSVLFWQFANEITRVREAKRFYSLFGFIGNFGLLASGSLIILSANLAKKAATEGIDAFGTNLTFQMIAVLVFGSLLIGIYLWMQKNVLTDKRLYNPGEGVKKKSKPKLSFGESFKYILTSKYLLMVSVLVLAYGISINLVEGVWKGQLKLQFPDSNDYNAFMGKLSFITGALTIVVMIIGANILRRFKWRTAALITPSFVLVTSVVFFAVMIYKNKVGDNSMFMGQSLLYIAVIVGLIQNAFSKGVKYSLFDSTVQMSYIPIDPELKVKGQAAVMIIAGRGGKSGGAFIQSTLLLIVGGGAQLSDLTGILGTVVTIVCVLWMASVFGLSKQFEALTAQRAAEEEEA